MEMTAKSEEGIRQPCLLAWLRLARVFHHIDRASADQMRQFGLTIAQFDVLAHVGAAEGITQQELADSLLVTKGNVCQLLDRMESNDLIVRRQCGRANFLSLTQKGRDLYQKIVPAHEELVARQFDSLSLDEQRQLWQLVRRLDRNLSAG